MKNVLVVVDMLNDFVHNQGHLYLKDSEKLIPRINRIANMFETEIFVKDWHEENDVEFNTWPAHCVQGTWGASRHEDLKWDLHDFVITKNTIDVWENPAFLSFLRYGGFSWILVVKAALIALFGFEAGFVLNDLVDVELDKRDVEPDLTNYWRPFGCRPLASGAIPVENARTLFFIMFGFASLISFTLPSPHSVYVFGIMVLSYGLEYYYQLQKRDQDFPLAQLIGRIDFSLFPVAGYLSNGHPDMLVLMYFLFFYPFAQTHLGINDIIDINNDIARNLKTIPTLYGVQNTKYWILGFTVLHLVASAWFYTTIGGFLVYTFIAGALILLVVNLLIQRGKTPQDWLKALPLFHATLFVYMVSLIANYFL